MSRTYDIAAYIWPAYTGKEPRAHIFWPEKRGEWQTVEHPTAKPEWVFDGASFQFSKFNH